jgi:hypothetical protein
MTAVLLEGKAIIRTPDDMPDDDIDDWDDTLSDGLDDDDWDDGHYEIGGSE